MSKNVTKWMRPFAVCKVESKTELTRIPPKVKKSMLNVPIKLFIFFPFVFKKKFCFAFTLYSDQNKNDQITSFVCSPNSHSHTFTI